MNNDVAWQHGANLILKLKRFVGESWIAGPKDTIVAELDAELLLEGPLYIDFRNDSKASLF